MITGSPESLGFSGTGVVRFVLCGRGSGTVEGVFRKLIQAHEDLGNLGSGGSALGI